MRAFWKFALTLAFVLASSATLLASGAPFTPSGRLTLISNTPVMNTDVVGTSTVYWDTYNGGVMPIYNYSTSAWNNFVFNVNELTLTLTSSQLSGKIYDVFMFYDSPYGLILGVGPAWNSLTYRGSGTGTTEITQVDGIWVNANYINLTNGPAEGGYSGSVQEEGATYVGSIYMTANGETSVMMKPSAAAGGTKNVIGIYNAYNRVPLHSISRDSTTSWTYGNSSWRFADNSSSNRVVWLDGLQQSPVRASVATQVATATGNEGITMGVDLDPTVTPYPAPGVLGSINPPTGASFFLHSPEENFPPQYGVHFVQAMEASPQGVTDTFYGIGNIQALTFEGEY